MNAAPGVAPGMGSTGMGLGAGGAGVGAGGAGANATGVRPPAGQRVLGETEKVAGQVLGNPTMVAKGQEKKVRSIDYLK